MDAIHFLLLISNVSSCLFFFLQRKFGFKYYEGALFVSLQTREGKGV